MLCVTKSQPPSIMVSLARFVLPYASTLAISHNHGMNACDLKVDNNGN